MDDAERWAGRATHRPPNVFVQSQPLSPANAGPILSQSPRFTDLSVGDRQGEDIKVTWL
jgi:hypothetical protein